MKTNYMLTPSWVQMQLVQGDGKCDSPTATIWPLILQPRSLSFHRVKSIEGKTGQGKRGFLKKNLNTFKNNYKIQSLKTFHIKNTIFRYEVPII